jgi:8-oxo-dGTP pyrophosphatase MutT (NUDIX family)
VTSSKEGNDAAKPTHAGGLVYRSVGKTIEYLLVRPKRGLDEWVLPKGHIEPREKSEQTAIREVEEETGVLARIIAPLKTIEFEMNGKLVRVKFFLMKFVSQGSPSETREIKWVAKEAALRLLTHRQNRDLLRFAEETRRKSARSEE